MHKNDLHKIWNCFLLNSLTLGVLTLKVPRGCNFPNNLGTAINQFPMTVRMSQGKICCVFHGTIFRAWSFHSRVLSVINMDKTFKHFFCLFSSASINLWYGSVEREKIIGGALLNLTVGLFPDISSVCVLLWTMWAKALIEMAEWR